MGQIVAKKPKSRLEREMVLVYELIWIEEKWTELSRAIDKMQAEIDKMQEKSEGFRQRHEQLTAEQKRDFGNTTR